MRSAPRVALALSIGLAASLTAQTTQSPEPPSPSQAPAPLPTAPSPQPAQPAQWHPAASDSYLSHVGVLCGSGASISTAATKPTVGCGAGITLLPLPLFFEIGVMGPQANRSSYSGYISFDGEIALAKQKVKYLPMAIVGYSRLFETGHALDYGFALGLPRWGKPKDPSSSLRLELRDYWTFANPNQHNVMLRIGWMGPATD